MSLVIFIYNVSFFNDGTQNQNVIAWPIPNIIYIPSYCGIINNKPFLISFV